MNGLMIVIMIVIMGSRMVSNFLTMATKVGYQNIRMVRIGKEWSIR